MAGLDKDIRGIPTGMFIILSEDASTLSGGQKQRLMIAGRSSANFASYSSTKRPAPWATGRGP